MNARTKTDVIYDFSSAWERKDGQWRLSQNAPHWVVVFVEYAYQITDEPNDPFITDALFQFSIALTNHYSSVENVDFTAYINNAILLTQESATVLPITYLTAWLNAGNKQRYTYVDDEMAKADIQDAPFDSLHFLLIAAYIRWLTFLFTNLKPIIISQVHHE